MAIYDLRLDVPGRAYINAQLLSLLNKGGSLFDAKRHLFTTEPYRHQLNSDDIYSYQPHDHSLAVSLLYCLIVVPREILNLPRDHQIYRDFDNEKLVSSFTVSEPSKIDSYQFIRCLRNSVAHALFSIAEENSEAHYTFWTEREPIFQAHIGHKNLIRFLSHVGQRLSNAVLAKK